MVGSSAFLLKNQIQYTQLPSRKTAVETQTTANYGPAEPLFVSPELAGCLSAPSGGAATREDGALISSQNN